MKKEKVDMSVLAIPSNSPEFEQLQLAVARGGVHHGVQQTSMSLFDLIGRLHDEKSPLRRVIKDFQEELEAGFDPITPLDPS